MRVKNTICCAMLTLACIVALHTSGYPQSPCKNVGITRAVITPTFVEVVLGLGVTTKDNLDQVNRWRIIRLSPGVDANPPVISRVDVKQSIPAGSGNSFYIDLHYDGAFEPKKTYIVAVDDISFDGCKPGKEAFVATSYNPSSTPSPPPVQASQYDLAKAADRSKADIYLFGSIEGLRTGKALKTVDLKVQLPFAASVFQKDNLLIPYLDLKFSSNPKADTDSLNIGAILRSGTSISDKGLVRGVVWDLDGRIEGNKNLKFTNGVVANRFSFTTRPGDWCNGSCYLYVQPFIGFEVGRNMRTPVTEAEKQTIARPLAGATAYLGFAIKKPLLDTISFQSEYIRRWSLTSEVGVEKAGDNYIPVFAGRGPRDYVQTKLEFGFSDYVGFAIGHTYGSLPPNFKLIDHKYSVGLTFKSLIMKRPK